MTYTRVHIIRSAFLDLRPASWGRRGSNDESSERIQVDALVVRDGNEVAGVWVEGWRQAAPGVETRLLGGLRAARIHRSACPVRVRFRHDHEYVCHDDPERNSRGSRQYWIRYEAAPRPARRRPSGKVLRILLVEDGPERLEVLERLARDHAWVAASTAARAIRLVESFPFDLVFLDYDLAGGARGDRVAEAIRGSKNARARVVVHSQSTPGARRIAAILPEAEVAPLSRITRSNATFKRLQEELGRGVDIDWGYVFSADVATARRR